MPTTSICVTVRGNRRSDNIPEGAGGSAEGNTPERRMASEPQISSQGLQFAGFTPIKPLPSIKEVVAQTQTLTQQPTAPATAEMPETDEVKKEEPEAVVTKPETPPTAPQEADITSSQTEEQPTQPKKTLETVDQAQPEERKEDFAECWKQMVDSIFQKKPAFYHQLYDYLPGYENDVISVDVENDFQKNQLEMSKRAMLEYWRNHFQLNVDEIEFVIREHERKKVIYTSEDKVNNMLEQNPELKDFLQVLNFRIKD